MISSLVLFLTILLAISVIVPVFFGGPWHPTSIKKIKQILEFCEAKPGEKLYDIGSGDGRVLITGAKHFGLNCVGLEIDPLKVWFSNLVINWIGIKDRVKILRRTIYNYDYSDADIIFIYMSHQAIDRLFPAIISKLKPDVKIVCYRFCLRRMAPVKVSSDKNIFLYKINKGNKLNGYS